MAVAAVLAAVVALVVGALVLRGDDEDNALDGAWSPNAAAVPSDGFDFIESNGTYTIRIGDEWDAAPLANGAAWYTGTGSRNFRDNVTIIVEDLPRTISLPDYVAISVSNAEQSGLAFDEGTRDDVRLSDGREAVVIDYSSTQRGFDLRHRLVVTVRDLVAVSVTFTCEADRFDQAVDEVDAYLRTVNVR